MKDGLIAPASTLRKGLRTVTQLIAAATKDTDAASVFRIGSDELDCHGAIIVIKGHENARYIMDVLVRQKLLTPGKPVAGDAA